MYVTIVTLTTRDYLKAHTRALITQGAEVHIAASPSPALFEELSRSGAVLHPVHIPREIDLGQDAMAHWTAFYRDVLKHRLIRIPFVTRQESALSRFLHSTSGGMFCSSSASPLCESRWSDEIASSTQTLNTISSESV